MASQNWWKIDHSRDKTKWYVFSISQLVEFSGGWKGPPLINSGALNDHNGWSLMVFDGSKQKNWNPWHSITKVSSVILFWLSREWKCNIHLSVRPSNPKCFSSTFLSQVWLGSFSGSSLSARMRDPKFTHKQRYNFHGVLWALSLFSKIRPWADNSHINLKYFAGRY